MSKQMNSSHHSNETGKKRSSFLSRATKSFVRSGGNRGADVETLRGTTGADFESEARITRGVETGCFCFGREAEEDRLILIKGPFCFVFVSADVPSPKYAIGLQYMKANVKTPQSSGETTVLLTDNLGNVQYELFFSSEELANRFATAVAYEADSAQTEMVRKRLGHDHLLNKRSSISYAEAIALKKVGEQPQAPISNNEILSTMVAVQEP